MNNDTAAEINLKQDWRDLVGEPNSTRRYRVYSFVITLAGMHFWMLWRKNVYPIELVVMPGIAVLASWLLQYLSPYENKYVSVATHGQIYLWVNVGLFVSSAGFWCLNAVILSVMFFPQIGSGVEFEIFIGALLSWIAVLTYPYADEE